MRPGRMSRPLVHAVVAFLLSASVAEAGVRASLEQYQSGKVSVAIECFTPTGKARHPAVLLLHGSGGLEAGTGPLFRTVARSIATKGYVVLIPHFFDRTDHVVGQALGDGEYEAFQEATRDAVEFAAGRNEVDPERIGMFGFSMGSGLSFSQAARDPRIKAVVCCSGSFPLGSKAKFPPTLFLHGQKDESTPASFIKKFEEALKDREIPCETHIYANTGHNFDATRFVDAGRRATAFFDKYLKKTAQGKETGG
jgi:dienelactone hydrolase